MTMTRPIGHHYDCVRRAVQGAFVAILIAVSIAAVAGPVYDQAIDAFQFNRLDEAVIFFSQAIETENPGARAYRYLGLSYEQLGRVEEAYRTYRAALDGDIGVASERARIALQLGLARARAGEMEAAVAAFDEALSLDNSLSPAYLNRANASVPLGTYERAISDYRVYLSLDPETGQRIQIEQMIALLGEAVEAQRIADEEAERQRQLEAEERRLAEENERRRAEEEARLAAERRQQVLSNVLQSLNSAAEDTLSFEMEGEDITDYNEEIDILD